MARKKFIRVAGAASLGMTAVPSLWGRSTAWQGANGRVRVAVIGIHGMGQNHIRDYLKQPNVEVATICDVDSNL